MSPDAQQMTTEQHRARNTALREATRVLKELHKQLPLTEDGKRVKSIPQKQAWEDGAKVKNELGSPEMVDDKALLVRLADICSHVAQGLHYIAIGGKPFESHLYCIDINETGKTKQVVYDAKVHKESMLRLSQMAPELKGKGWEKCQRILLSLAAVMLVATGILAAVPTAGVSLVLALGGAGILTAGAGFFVGRHTGLAGAVSNVKMKTNTKDQSEIDPQKNTPN